MGEQVPRARIRGRLPPFISGEGPVHMVEPGDEVARTRRRLAAGLLPRLEEPAAARQGRDHPRSGDGIGPLSGGVGVGG